MNFVSAAVFAITNILLLLFMSSCGLFTRKEKAKQSDQDISAEKTPSNNMSEPSIQAASSATPAPLSSDAPDHTPEPSLSPPSETSIDSIRIPNAIVTLTDKDMRGFKPDFGYVFNIIDANVPGFPAGSIMGTASEDNIACTAGSDRVMSLGGDDLIQGRAGNDFIEAGVGNDVVYGGRDDDELYGQAGHDHLSGDLGNDKLFGGEGNDWLDGGPGNDQLDGGLGNDTYLLYPGSGTDSIVDQASGKETVICAGFIDETLSVVLEGDQIRILAANRNGQNSILATISTFGIDKSLLNQKWDIRCRNDDKDPTNKLTR
jgi:hypothetical protein